MEAAKEGSQMSFQEEEVLEGMQKKATGFNTTFFLINSVYSEIFVLSAAEPGQI